MRACSCVAALQAAQHQQAVEHGDGQEGQRRQALRARTCTRTLCGDRLIVCHGLEVVGGTAATLLALLSLGGCPGPAKVNNRAASTTSAMSREEF